MTAFWRQPGNWLKAGLGASLALNLVLVALLLRVERPPRRDLAAMQAQMEALLPPADRPRFGATLEAGRPAAQAALNRHRAARAEAEEAVGREPFDPAAMRAAMQAARGEWQQFSTALEETLIEAVTALSPEGRQRLAEDQRRRRERARQARAEAGQTP